jgi:hypothetical protein
VRVSAVLARLLPRIVDVVDSVSFGETSKYALVLQNVKDVGTVVRQAGRLLPHADQLRTLIRADELVEKLSDMLAPHCKPNVCDVIKNAICIPLGVALPAALQAVLQRRKKTAPARKKARVDAEPNGDKKRKSAAEAAEPDVKKAKEDKKDKKEKKADTKEEDTKEKKKAKK